jgi:hypothetical protein
MSSSIQRYRRAEGAERVLDSSELVVTTKGLEVTGAKTDVGAEASEDASVVATTTVLDSKRGRADMFDGEELESDIPVDVGKLSERVKDGLSSVGVETRLADDLRRRAANLVRLDNFKEGEVLRSAERRISSLELIEG